MKSSRSTPGRRPDGRRADALRPICIELNCNRYAEGSVLYALGETRVLCTATLEEGVPGFLRGSGTGWITAEYGMLPRSTHTRNRDSRGAVSGRTKEIQRLVGRSLRAIADRSALGERTLTIDCDVLQADGGTRITAVNGGFLALSLAAAYMKKKRLLSSPLLTGGLAAVSVGMLDGRPVLDMTYEEDARADVDMNFVMTSAGRFVEIQATAEGTPFSESDMKNLIHLAKEGCHTILQTASRILSNRRKGR